MSLSNNVIRVATILSLMLTHALAQSQIATLQPPTVDAAIDSSQVAAAVRAPRILATEPSCLPVYPAAAMRSGASGTTGIRLSVSAAGQILGAEITRSSGPTREHRMLDRAALQAFSTCPFVPGIDSAGRAAGGTVDLTFNWHIESASPASAPSAASILVVPAGGGS